MLGIINQICEEETLAYIVYNETQDQQKKTLKVRRKSEFVIGRGVSSDIIINDRVVSRKHCVIENDENGDWILYDTSSSGVLVNKEHVPSGASCRLCDGDIILVIGAFNYSFCFYIGEPCQKKKRKIVNDTLSDVNNRNKGRKETIINEESIFQCWRKVNICLSMLLVLFSCYFIIVNSCYCYAIIVITILFQYYFSIRRKVFINISIDGSGIIADEVLNLNDVNAKAMVKEDGRNDEDASSLRSELKKIMDENFKLKEQCSLFAEAYSKHVLYLKLEIKMAESRNKLSDYEVKKLRCELAEINGSLLEKENELKLMEARLFFAEQNQVKEKDIQNEVMLKVKEDTIELLEYELNCSVCNEIIIEATVLNCTHLLCYFCIDKWMERKRDCPICRTKVENLVKSPAIDSFIDKMLQRFSYLELFENRKQAIEDRKKEKMIKSINTHRLETIDWWRWREAVGWNDQIQLPYIINSASITYNEYFSDVARTNYS